MLSFPITDKKDVYGVINLNSTSMKTFSEDEIYFVSIIANLILTAVKLRRKAASARIPGHNRVDSKRRHARLSKQSRRCSGEYTGETAKTNTRRR